jgi:hypothetical protein
MAAVTERRFPPPWSVEDIPRLLRRLSALFGSPFVFNLTRRRANFWLVRATLDDPSPS